MAFPSAASTGSRAPVWWGLAPRLPRSHLCEQGSGGPGKLLCMPWGLYNLRKHLTIHVPNVASASRPFLVLKPDSG